MLFHQSSNIPSYNIDDRQIIELDEFGVIGAIESTKENPSSKESKSQFYDSLLRCIQNNEMLFAPSCFVNQDAIFSRVKQNEGEFINLTSFYQPLDVNAVNNWGKYSHTDSYLFFKVYSSRDQEVFLLSSTDDNLEIFHNTRVLEQIDNPRLGIVSATFTNATKLDLTPGENLIILKVSNLNYESVSKFSLTLPFYAMQYFAENNPADLLRRGIIKEGDKLHFSDLISKLSFTKANLKIRSLPENKLVLDTDLKKLSAISVDNILPLNRLNEVTLTLEDRFVFQQKLFIGEVTDFVNELNQRDVSKGRSENDQAVVAGLNQRIDKLLKVGYSSGDEWVRKVNLVLDKLSKIILSGETSAQLIKSGGINIGSYKSKVDGSNQYYVCVSPENYSTDSLELPLVVVLRPNFANHYNFLVSGTIAKQYELERLKELSNKYGYAFLLSSNRHYLYENLSPISETEIFESIASISDCLSIDKQRIFLYGNCAAGKRALVMASRYPDKFAGLAIYSPTYNTNQNIPLQNLSNLPIFLRHDQNDLHTPIQSSIALLEDASSRGLASIEHTFDKSGSRFIYNSLKVCEDALVYFDQYQQKKNVKSLNVEITSPKYVDYYWFESVEPISNKDRTQFQAHYTDSLIIGTENISYFEINLTELPIKEDSIYINVNGSGRHHATNENARLEFEISEKGGKTALKKNKEVSGPINDFFASKFIQIIPDHDSYFEHNFISQPWQDYFLVPVLSRNESEIKSKEDLESNIILFADSYVNPMLNDLIRQLPIIAFDDALILGNKKYFGEDLKYLFVYPNPVSDKHYILCTNITDILMDRKLWIDGIYDVEVMHRKGHEYYHLETTDFNGDWELRY